MASRTPAGSSNTTVDVVLRIGQKLIKTGAGLGIASAFGLRREPLTTSIRWGGSQRGRGANLIIPDPIHMKLPALQTLSGVAAATLLAAAPAGALDINDSLGISGYIVGSARYIDQGGSDSTLDLDATKLMANVKTAPVSGTVSFYSSGTDTVSILDAYFTYDLGGGTTITAGKFLSYHGYEAFDIPNMLQITYANDFAALIPGYHKGVRLDYAQGNSKMGVAVLDQVYGPDAITSDGDLSNGAGFEAFYSYTQDALTAYVGLAYDHDKDDPDNVKHTMVDFWTQYVAGSTTFAGEFCAGKADGDTMDVKSYFATLLVDFALDPKSNLELRGNISEDKVSEVGVLGSTKPRSLKGTVAYRYKVSDNFTLVTEASYSDMNSAAGDNVTFLGAQGRFTF